MVKAGALGGAHVKSWDRTWSSPDFQKSPQGRVGTEVTSPCNCGRRKPNFGVRMAEWLRPGLWEVLTIKLRGIEPGRILAHKTVHRLGGW